MLGFSHPPIFWRACGKSQWYKVTYQSTAKLNLNRKRDIKGITKTDHRLNIGGFESRYQSFVVVNARLIDLTDSVGKDSSPRDGKPII